MKYVYQFLTKFLFQTNVVYIHNTVIPKAGTMISEGLLCNQHHTECYYTVNELTVQKTFDYKFIHQGPI